MRRFSYVFGCLFCPPCLVGCLGVYYPGLDCISKVGLEAQPSEVHAFRVHVKNDGIISIPISGDPWDKTSSETLSEIPLNNLREVPTQIRPSVNGAMAGVALMACWLSYVNNSIALRLYRPGYEVIAIKSWERAKPINWIRAADSYSQEKVLDKLLPFDELEPGWVSEAHRAALLFGAAEYERLAAATQSDRKKVLADKAERLRRRADMKKPTISDILHAL